ncbi:MAG: hypothetical protein U1E10_10905, partial [Bdellovibrionales bacterium]|nr:hypothetical protein [Bdellovibrionales bacterium]
FFVDLLFVFLIFSTIQGFRNFVTFGARARQSEAKSNLLQVYQIRLAQTESGSGPIQVFNEYQFKTGLNRYVIGFSEKCRVKDEILNTAQLRTSEVVFAPGIELAAQEYLKNVPCAEGFPEKWEAYAIGQHRSEEFPIDVWKINQDKQLAHLPSENEALIGAFGRVIVGIISIFSLLSAAALWGWARRKWYAKVNSLKGKSATQRFFLGPFAFQTTAIFVAVVFFWNVVEVLRQLGLLLY